jgi:hypothetical protein
LRAVLFLFAEPAAEFSEYILKSILDIDESHASFIISYLRDSFRIVHEYEIKTVKRIVGTEPESFPQKPFEIIATHGVSEFFAYGNTDP